MAVAVNQLPELVSANLGPLLKSDTLLSPPPAAVHSVLLCGSSGTQIGDATKNVTTGLSAPQGQGFLLFCPLLRLQHHV